MASIAPRTSESHWHFQGNRSWIGMAFDSHWEGLREKSHMGVGVQNCGDWHRMLMQGEEFLQFQRQVVSQASQGGYFLGLFQAAVLLPVNVCCANRRHIMIVVRPTVTTVGIARYHFFHILYKKSHSTLAQQRK
jgi:hypothetical protein